MLKESVQTCALLGFHWISIFQKECRQGLALYLTSWLVLLGKVNEHHIEVLVLFSTLFLNLPCAEDYVSGTAICPLIRTAIQEGRAL